MAQSTYLTRKGEDADFANVTASGTLTVTGDITGGNYTTITEVIAPTTSLDLADNVLLQIGTGDDVTIRWDATDLDILAAANNSVIKFGNGTASFDLWVYGATANDNIIFDASAKTLAFDGVDIFMEDADNISFGDAQDVVMAWDGTDFDITAAANNSIIKFGNGTNSFDLWVYGSAAGNYLLWDASANSITPVGAATIRTLPALADPGNAGAIPVTVSGYVPLVTAGAETRTLAAPTYIGQELLIYSKTAVGNCVVTCTTTLNEAANNTITFANTGESVRMVAVEEGANLRWRCPVADPTSILSTV